MVQPAQGADYSKSESTGIPGIPSAPATSLKWWLTSPQSVSTSCEGSLKKNKEVCPKITEHEFSVQKKLPSEIKGGKRVSPVQLKAPASAKTEKEEALLDRSVKPAIILIFDAYMAQHVPSIQAELKKQLGVENISAIPHKDVNEATISETNFLALDLLSNPSKMTAEGLYTHLFNLSTKYNHNCVLVAIDRLMMSSQLYKIANSGFMKNGKFEYKYVKHDSSLYTADPLITKDDIPDLAKKIADVYNEFIQQQEAEP